MHWHCLILLHQIVAEAYIRKRKFNKPEEAHFHLWSQASHVLVIGAQKDLQRSNISPQHWRQTSVDSFEQSCLLIPLL